MARANNSIENGGKVRIAVIGAGVRAVSYLRNVPEALRDRIQFVAVADPVPERRKLVMDRFPEWGTPTEYPSGEALLEGATFDGLIIGSYNVTHADFAVQALDSGAVVLLEKPVATSLEQCQALWNKFRQKPEASVYVGFVLRYAPFFRKLNELVEQNAVGEMMAIDMDENLSQSISSGFFRGWRRLDALSGGFMVEKSSHDFDILHCLTGSRVRRVYSIGKRTHFVKRPRSEQHRRFDSDMIRNLALDYGDVHTKQIFENTPDGSMYDAESDVPDHQAVMLEFENGVLVNFMACHGQPRVTRRLRIFGSNGSLEGDIDRGVILQEVPYEEKLGAETITHRIVSDDSGHDGADSVINDAFWDSVFGGKGGNCAGIREGIEAVLVGLAAEESKSTGLPVDVGPMREAVFGLSVSVPEGELEVATS